MTGLTGRVVQVVVAAAILIVSACGGGPAGTPAPEGHRFAPVTVFAAASLRSVFDEIVTRVERETGAEIRVQYAGSADLATQLVAGAPGDVFASANETQMTSAVDRGVMADGGPRVFATNTLTVVTPPANPRGVRALADLAAPGVRTVVCAPQVPCGAATAELLAASGVQVRPVSEESQVTDVLGKVSSGQADAGLVYATDARTAGDRVHVVPTPEGRSVLNRYPIGVTAHGAADAARRATAERFVAAVLDERGQEQLADAGFGPPTSGATR